VSADHTPPARPNLHFHAGIDMGITTAAPNRRLFFGFLARF